MNIEKANLNELKCEKCLSCRKWPPREGMFCHNTRARNSIGGISYPFLVASDFGCVFFEPKYPKSVNKAKELLEKRISALRKPEEIFKALAALGVCQTTKLNHTKVIETYRQAVREHKNECQTCKTCGGSREVDDTIHSVNAGVDISKPCPDCSPKPDPLHEQSVIALRHIAIWICEACLEGKGEECHTPGCALWLHTVSLPIAPEMYEIINGSKPEQPSGEFVWYFKTFRIFAEPDKDLLSESIMHHTFDTLQGSEVVKAHNKVVSQLADHIKRLEQGNKRQENCLNIQKTLNNTLTTKIDRLEQAQKGE